MSRIQLRNVEKTFADVPVLQNINLDIDPGEFCVFIGPSGCGKSTLLRMIAGLEDATDGDIEIDGVVVNDLPPSARNVAMVFQSYALYPHMTVYENMAFGLQQQKCAKPEIERRVQDASRILHLDGLLDRKPKALSGGQRQRVAIGRAIVRKPKVFLFDEPLSNLDAALRVATRVEIARLHRELGSASMVYVTHDQVEAMTLASKIVLLRPDPAAHGGQSIAQAGHPLELYHHPANQFVAGFIGSPSMNFLPAIATTLSDHTLEALWNGSPCVAHVEGSVQPGEPVTLGIRPEHVRVGEGPHRAQVTHVERLGEHSYVYLSVPQSSQLPLLAKVQDERIAIGDTLPFTLPPESVHVFRRDGQALRRSVPAGGEADVAQRSPQAAPEVARRAASL
ncbi:sn-glycerol-3-phosphate ABC transporter ATP-binding protein UgpC [Schlegelella sp. S2-27]|uniref:Sn-glycerol-3-phosphate ABC transporter ATP-binding protein UgpC n=1 Tax=Caldimonas mangrovi TaxID=2944811 RepID=A0ABT0YMM9_9BURK|nr:sn-glycerol-3-phosphate ABC transporter ATP-binding protein UgpC [Caldimonas mangrovi]MCM5679986.1 sn-glycerol-3-phosphate ABC transporter ATP-binding protein UgpC [Caldimonas mangrovi]